MYGNYLLQSNNIPESSHLLSKIVLNLTTNPHVNISLHNRNFNVMIVHTVCSYGQASTEPDAMSDSERTGLHGNTSRGRRFERRTGRTAANSCGKPTIICDWMGQMYLGRIQLIATNPGPVAVDYPKLNGVKILHQNLGSVTGRISDIHDLARKFKSKAIIAITESGLVKDQPNEIVKIPGWKFVRIDNNQRKSLGILVFYTSDIKLKSTKKFTNQDTSIIFNEFSLGNDTLHFGTVYRLPDASHNFFDFFDSALQDVIHSDRKVVIMGDLNIDLFRNDAKQIKFCEILDFYQLGQHISTATRCVTQSATLIDHVITSASVQADQIVNSNLMISDHHIVGCRVKNFGAKVPPPIEHQKCRLHAIGNGFNFSKCDTDKLANELSETDWTELQSALTVDEKWDAFYNIFMAKIELCTPKHLCKCGRMKPNKRRSEPWFTSELKTLKTECDTAYRQYRILGRTPELWDTYRLLRNKFNTSKNASRNRYFKALILNCETYKGKWQLLNKLRGKESQQETQIEKLVDGDTETTNNGEIVKAMNKYFAEIGAKTLEEVNTLATELGVEPHNFPRNSPQNSFNFKPPTPNEVEKAIRALRIDKPGGPTGIPPKIIKEVAAALVYPITHLFETCVVHSTVPTHFKEAFVTPIFKKGARCDPSNYRPISVTGIFSKLFEQILSWQIKAHLKRYSVLSTTQYGFRDSHSTTHAMIDGMDHAYRELNVKSDKFVSFLYLDLSRAFDVVPHDRLVRALDSIGFDVPSRNLMFSYLTDRVQATKLGAKLSNKLRVRTGVPQGSLLGPLLFAIFVNDCNRMLANAFSKIVQYADDTCIITSADSKDELVARTEANLLAAKKYFTSLGLKLNISKTQFVPATNSGTLSENIRELVLFRNSDSEPTVNAQTSAVNLGLIVDDNLLFGPHKEKIIGKLKSVIFLVRSIRGRIPLSAAINLYHTLFLSAHDYGACVFATTGYGTTDLNNKIEVLHRKMLRCVHNYLPWNVSDADLYEAACVPKLTDHRSVIVANMAHSCLYDRAPVNVASTLTRSNNVHAGAVSEIRLTYARPVRTNIVKASFGYRAAHIWNGLPHELRGEAVPDRFKRRLQKHVADHGIGEG